jgi:hypothetical protein
MPGWPARSAKAQLLQAGEIGRRVPHGGMLVKVMQVLAESGTFTAQE